MLGVRDPDDRARRRREVAVEHPVIHVVDQLLAHGAVHERPTRQLAGTFAVCLSACREELDVVDGHIGLALGADAAGELRAAADRAPLVVQLSRCHLPASVDFADDRVVAEFEVVEELFAEFDRPVHLLDAPQRDPRAVDRHQEHRQALVLGHVPVGARQHQPVVGGECACAPSLRAVDDPFVALAVGTGDDAGEIRSAAGLGQQLDEYLVAAQARPKCVAASALREPVSRMVAAQIVKVGVFRMTGSS